METCQVNVSNQNTISIYICLEPLPFATLQNAKKKKKIKFNLAIEVICKFSYADHKRNEYAFL